VRWGIAAADRASPTSPSRCARLLRYRQLTAITPSRPALVKWLTHGMIHASPLTISHNLSRGASGASHTTRRFTIDHHFGPPEPRRQSGLSWQEILARHCVRQHPSAGLGSGSAHSGVHPTSTDPSVDKLILVWGERQSHNLLHGDLGAPWGSDMSRFRCRVRIMPQRNFADNVTRCLVWPVQQGAPDNTSESRTVTPNPEAIYRIPAGRWPVLDAFRPAGGRCHRVLAGA